LIHWENHCSGTDPFTTAETTARETWYGVPGYPTIRIDGSRSRVGASSCASAAGNYRTDINARLAETGNVSPVEITGSYFPDGTQIIVSTTFRLVDPASLPSLRATILIYEDDVMYQGSPWEGVTRKIYDQTVTLTNQGDEVSVSPTITANPAWNLDNIHVVAYLQQTSGSKPVIQAFRVPLLRDFTVAFSQPIRSVPSGNGYAEFEGVLTNIGSATDTFTLQLGTAFGSWTSEFYVCGDPNPHTTPVQLSLAPNQACAVRMRVHTDNALEIRSGSFRTSSAFSGRSQASSLTVFNKSFSIMMVDNDGSSTTELPIVNGLIANGYLFTDYNVYESGSFPGLVDMAGYDIVIWETSRRTSAILGDPEVATLMSYIDMGGALFLTSQHYLNLIPTGGNTFTHNYLGVASFTLDKGYAQLNGVAGDAIGDGLVLPLNFAYPAFRKGDDAVPAATATTSLLANDNSHAMIRNVLTTGQKVVFMPEAFDGVNENDPDPNNTRVLLGRVLDWLKPSLADAPDLGAIATSRISMVRPNPFNPKAEISFMVSPSGATGDVRLDIFDASGRYIANLARGAMTPGPHVQTWNGLSDGGRSVESGVYFARLTTVEGVASQKMVLLK
jgi:hypothetical protein